ADSRPARSRVGCRCVQANRRSAPAAPSRAHACRTRPGGNSISAHVVRNPAPRKAAPPRRPLHPLPSRSVLLLEVGAAVYQVALPGDEGGILAREVQHQRGAFLDAALPAYRLIAANVLVAFPRVLLGAGYRARPDAVGGDVVLAEFARETAR